MADPDTNRVLVFRRTDEALGEHPWQFPQGGIKAGESPLEAIRRELAEEIGTTRFDILAQAPDSIRYEYPPEVAEALSRGKPEKRGHAGQEQTWFLVRLLDGEGSIRFEGPEPEFDAFRWVTPQEALDLVVPFKAEAYRAGLRALGLLRDEPAAP